MEETNKGLNGNRDASAGVERWRNKLLIIPSNTVLAISGQAEYGAHICFSSSLLQMGPKSLENKF